MSNTKYLIIGNSAAAIGGVQGILGSDGVVTVVVKRARAILDVSGSDLIENLLERSHT